MGNIATLLPCLPFLLWPSFLQLLSHRWASYLPVHLCLIHIHTLEIKRNNKTKKHKKGWSVKCVEDVHAWTITHNIMQIKWTNNWPIALFIQMHKHISAMLVEENKPCHASILGGSLSKGVNGLPMNYLLLVNLFRSPFLCIHGNRINDSRWCAVRTSHTTGLWARTHGQA